MPRRSKTPGVRLVCRQREDGPTWYGRVQDPLTKRWSDVNLTKLGLTTEALRAKWRRSVSEKFVDTKRSKTLGTDLTTIEEAVTRYLADCRGRRKRESTLKNYKRVLCELREWLLERPVLHIQSVTPLDLRAFRGYLIASGKYGGSTLRTYLTIAGTAFEWWRAGHFALGLSRESILDAFNGKGIPVVQPAPVCLRSAELGAILKAATSNKDPRCAAFLATIALTGMRYEEAAALEWAEVDMEAGEVKLGSTSSDPRTKTRTARTVALDICPSVAEILRAMPKAGPYVFAGHVPLKRRRVTDTWLDFCQVIGRRWVWKDLRSTNGAYTACAPSIFGGASAYLTAKRLGHGVKVSERFYLSVVKVPPEAKTVEAAMGCAAEFQALVARVAQSRGRTS